MEFTEFFRNLENFGLIDALLPFLLIFTIIFAVLQKSNLLGTNRRNFNIIVATVISLMAVIPHVTGSYPAGKDVIQMMIDALPQVSIVIVAIIMALLLIGVFGGEARWVGGSLSGIIAIISFIIIIYIFGSAAGVWNNFFTEMGWWNSETGSLVVIILVFAIVIWYITREPTQADRAAGFSRALDQFGNMFKK